MRLIYECFSALIVAMLLSATSGLNADTITLRPSVRLSANSNSITLGDIADLDGPEALSFAALPVAKPSDSNDIIELSINDIRALLDDAGAHWGRVNLSGRSVIDSIDRYGGWDSSA